MISFCEERFPTDISYGVSGGPCFVTEIVETAAGCEYRNMRMPYSRSRYNLASGIKTEEDLKKVIDFFRAMRGRAIAFRFKDWLDYKVTKQLIAVVNDNSKLGSYQLLKSYKAGQVSEVRKISKPVPGTIKIYVDDQEYAEVDVDDKTGIVSFATSPPKGAVITADFEFDVAARFDTDQISSSIESYGVYSTQEIAVIEVRL